MVQHGRADTDDGANARGLYPAKIQIRSGHRPAAGYHGRPYRNLIQGRTMQEPLPHENGFHVSWDQLHRDARALAWRLDGKGPDDGAWRAVVAITRGGMAPAMIVARELDIRIVDTISVKS